MSAVNLPPVPLMRETVFVPVNSAEGQPINALRQTASRTALVTFAVFFLPGLAAALLFKSATLFVVFFLVAMLCAAGAFAFRLRQPGLGQVAGSGFDAQTQQILRLYQPFLSKLQSGGFDAAAENIKAIVKGVAQVRAQAIQLFSIADETLAFYVARLVQVAEAKRLIGEERELKRLSERFQDRVKAFEERGETGSPERDSLRLELQSVQERLDKLEVLNKAALQMTADLQKLRGEIEWALVRNVAGDEASQRARAFLTESMEREQRVAHELASLGL